MPQILGIDVSITGDTLYGPITLLDNTVNGVAASFPLTNKFNQLQYSIFRDGVARTGRILLSVNDLNTIPTISDDFTKTADAGIVFNVQINGSNLDLIYTSISMGSNATFKYYLKNWS